MGRKYGSLHVLAKNADANKKALQAAYDDLMRAQRSEIDITLVGKALGLDLRGGNEEFLRLLFKRAQDAKRRYSVVARGKYLSLYDEYLSFENIESAASGVSGALRAAVLYASVFDEDVFVFGVCADGAVLSRHVSGECAAYGLAPQALDTARLADFLECAPDEMATLEALDGAAFETALQAALNRRHIELARRNARES